VRSSIRPRGCMRILQFNIYSKSRSQDPQECSPALFHFFQSSYRERRRAGFNPRDFYKAATTGRISGISHGRVRAGLRAV
jgi:hypothetical protein